MADLRQTAVSPHTMQQGNALAPAPVNSLAQTAVNPNNNFVPPKITGVNRLIDVLVRNLNPSLFPTAGKLFIETAQGERRPITEKDFSPEELETLRLLIDTQNAASGSIQYKDYIAAANKERQRTGKLPVTLTPGLASLFDALGNIQTSLGRFQYKKDQDGNLIVVDTYDFNPAPQNTNKEEFASASSLNPYAMLRQYAGQKIPPGQGRSIKINLGK